jgi:acetate kinase
VSRVRILAVNAGSTSLKLSVLEGEETVARAGAFEDLQDPGRLDAVVHRVVHGGDRRDAATIDDAVVRELEGLVDLAPLHQPAALDALDRARRVWPGVPHVACFDTAFHTTIPEAARTYALPAHLRERVRVYGFHGLSHAWSVGRVEALAPGARRVLVAHLGGGHSLCGAVDGRSAVTTMGFTPLDGLVMATRSGALDPGAVLWLADRVDGLADVLEHHSGLLGLCGTADMREVLARTDEDARRALDVYVHRFVSLAGGCVAAMEGLDALVFTGGVGEHAAGLRERVCARLGWLGVGIDPEPRTEGEISAPGAPVRTFVVPAREDLQMAAEARRLIAGDRR